MSLKLNDKQLATRTYSESACNNGRIYVVVAAHASKRWLNVDVDLDHCWNGHAHGCLGATELFKLLAQSIFYL